MFLSGLKFFKLYLLRLAEYANILQGLLEKDSIKKRLLKDSDLKKGLTFIDDDLTMNEVVTFD